MAVSTRTLVTSGSFSEELICSVCLEIFDTPVLLPCAHSFCRQCLLDIQERGRPKSPRTPLHNAQNNAVAQNTNERKGTSPGILVCPQCRQQITLGPEGIAALPKNTALANIIMSVEEENRAQNIACEVCDYEPARLASKTCSDCSVTYCLACFRQLHPMRGAFRYHAIKEANALPMMRCSSPVFMMRTESIRSSSRSRRFTPSREGYVTDPGADSGDESGILASQGQLNSVRRQIKLKRKELNNANKTVQNLIKTTETETEERMREIRSTCSQINEGVGEREAAMLNTVSQKRHEAVRQCCALTSELKDLTSSLDLIEDQLADLISVTAVHTGTDVTNDVDALKKKISAIQTKPLVSRSKQVPRQPKIGEIQIAKHIASWDFVKEIPEMLSPVLTEFVYRPVSNGPALVEVKWRAMENVEKFKLAATRKDSKGQEVTSSVELPGSTTSYLLNLPWIDMEYYVSLEAMSKEGLKHPIVGRGIRTLPYVYCFRAKFSANTCHKRMAVSMSRDEMVHRKCKQSNLQNVCSVSSSFQRLEHIEGATTDETLPQRSHVYWEAFINFKVFGKLGDSKLLCDIGVTKSGCEDGSVLLCDNVKSYCGYLARRKNKIALEFWNGPNNDILPRSIPLLDLDQEKEKTIKLGFYFDAMKRIFAIVSPANNSILCQFNVKFVTLLPQCGLYCPDHVYVMIKFTEVQKLPNILGRLMKGNT